MLPTWFDSPEFGIGSRLMLRRLRDSMSALGAFGMPLPPTGRHAKALSALEDFESNPDRLKDGAAALELVATAQRDAFDLYLIAYAATLHRADVLSAFTRDRFRVMAKGPLVGDGSNPRPRNIQFELLVASYLSLGGFDIAHGEPDLLLSYGDETVGVACKRVQSLSADQVARNFSDGVKQIRGQGRRGFVALSIEPHFKDLDVGAGTTGDSDEMSATFDRALSQIERFSKEPGILGYIAFGRMSSWGSDPRHPHRPSLHTVTPFRWFGWPDLPADKGIYEALIPAWSNTLDSVLASLGQRYPSSPGA